MRSSFLAAVLGTLILVAHAFGQTAVAQVEASDTTRSNAARAEKLTKDAIQVGDAGDWKRARTMLEEAFALKPSFDIAANLALAEEKTGDRGLAGDHLAYAIRTFPVVGKAEHRKKLQERYDRLAADVARVALQCSEADARVFVDDRLRGQTPTADAIHLDPGTRTLRVEKRGYRTQVQAHEATAGSQTSLTITLERDPSVPLVPTATAAPSVTSAPSSTVAPPGDKPVWPAVVLGSVAAVGVGMGIGFVVASTGENDAAQETADRCGRTSACAQEGDDAIDRANLFQGVGITSFAVGGAALVGMVVYLAVPFGSREDDAVSVVPIVGPSTQGLSLGGRF